MEVARSSHRRQKFYPLQRCCSDLPFFHCTKFRFRYLALSIKLPLENQILAQLALTRIVGVGPVYTKKLVREFGDVEAVFRADPISLGSTGLPKKQVDAIRHFSGYTDLEAELRYVRKNGIRTLFFTDPDYPQRLNDLNTAPALLFYQGNVSLNAKKIIAIAGTRHPTRYGTEIAEQLVREIAGPDLLILSGLAYGIDAAAHRAALKYDIPTVGVLGSGLGNIYPPENRDLARKMQKRGGILSSFPYLSGASKHNFPLRNRLLAGLCDALIVVESGVPGGSLSAANAAAKFDKKVFAVPGRLTDDKSRGCLELIHEKKALPLLSAEQFFAAMAWKWSPDRPTHQPSLPFTELSALANSSPDHRLLTLLREKESLSFDDLINLSRQSIPALSGSLLDLEIRGIIRSLPGKRYCLVK